MVDLVSQLDQRRSDPAPITVVVLPFTPHNLRGRTNGLRRRGNLAARVDRIFVAVGRSYIEQPSLYLRRYGCDLPSIPRRRHHLAVEEERMIDREKETADATGLHDLDIESFGK